MATDYGMWPKVPLADGKFALIDNTLILVDKVENLTLCEDLFSINRQQKIV